ncbi:MAG: hypothetical protein VW226_07880 [Rhodospirillaceae bacterium]
MAVVGDTLKMVSGGREVQISFGGIYDATLILTGNLIKAAQHDGQAAAIKEG